MKRILVIQTAKLGDMVCTTPVFRAIKLAYPESKVFVMGDSLNKQILWGNPNIYEYIELKDSSVKLFKKLDLDVAILLTPNPSILYKLLRTRVRKIIVPKVIGGFSPYATKIYKFLSLFVTTAPHRFGHYAPQEYLNMLRPLGIVSNDTKKRLYFSKESAEKIKNILSLHSGLKIAISPSAGNKIKNWGGKNFAKLADNIYEKWKPSIFIIGGSRDRAEVADMISNLHKKTRVVDLSMKFTVDELKAFISSIDLFIAVDTGPVYIAEAFDVPTVDIIGPMDENEQPPRGLRNKVVYIKTRKSPMLHIMNARVYDAVESRRQIEDITPDMVMEEVESLIHQTNEIIKKDDR